MSRLIPRFALYLFTIFCLGLAIMALSAAVLAATQDIGKVVSLTPGASALRDGKGAPGLWHQQRQIRSA